MGQDTPIVSIHGEPVFLDEADALASIEKETLQIYKNPRYGLTILQPGQIEQTERESRSGMDIGFSAREGHVREFSFGTSGTWPSTALDLVPKFTELEVLRLAGLPSGVPGWIAGFPKLRVLILDGLYADSIPDRAFDGLAALECLYVRGDAANGGRRGLRAFPEAVARLPNLRVLDLSGNPMGVPMPWEEPTRWAPPWRDMDDGAFAAAEAAWRARPGRSAPLAGAICKAKRLEELRIATCGFTALPECIGDLADLRVLDISGNPIGGLPEMPQLVDVAGLLGIEARDEARGKLPASMSRLRKLEELWANGCMLTELPDLQDAPLKAVHVAGNHLTTIPEYLLFRREGITGFEYDFSDNPTDPPLKWNDARSSFSPDELQGDERDEWKAYRFG